MRAFIIFFGFIFMINVNVSGQWIQTDGPYGKTCVNTIICKDSLILASTWSGIFYKHQQAEHWSLYSLETLSSWSVKGDSLFFCNYPYGPIEMLNLTDPGIPPKQISPLTTNELLFADSCFYSSNLEAGFVKTNLNGLTFTQYNTGLPADTIFSPWLGWVYHYDVTSIAFKDGYVFCGTQKGVFRNTPALGTWTGVNNGLSTDLVMFVKVFDSALYTGIGNKLYVSQDNGENWSMLLQAETDVTCLWHSGSHLYAGTRGMDYSIPMMKGKTGFL